jgi:cytochrome P450
VSPAVDDLVRAALRPPYPEDPYPAYAALRERAPVCRDDEGLWLASTYDTALAVFRSPELGQGSGPQSRLRRDPRYDGSPALETLGHMLPFLDPPDHTRLRRLIGRAFTPRAVERLRGFVADLADRLVDTLPAGGPVDVMADFADHIPVAVICELLGAPQDRHADLVRWADALVHAIHPTVDDEGLAHADDGARQFRAYVEELIDDRRAAPRDDLLTGLVQAEAGGDALDARELVSTVVVFIGAGIENTKHLIGMAIDRLLRRPDQLALVRDGRVTWGQAVEEVLRLEPPVQVSLPRVALADVEVGGVPIARGERVSAVIGAANRDPAVFDRPDEMDVRRSGEAPNLSLASGAHYCTGAGLARLEASVAVERFLTRLPAAAPAGPPELRDDIRPSLRGYRRLPVATGPRAGPGPPVRPGP